jgi:hypothetical protein
MELGKVMAPVGRRMLSPLQRDALLLFGFAVLVASLFGVIVAATRPRAFTTDSAGLRFLSDPYVGSKACAECHPGEEAHYVRSGHATTLRPAAERNLAGRLDGTTVEDPELPDVRWSYQFHDRVLRIARKAHDGEESWVADYAFGSGHHATTFVSVVDPKIPAVLEHRLTHYTQKGTLGLTPGHDTRPPPPGLTTHGGELPARIARECFRCHTTQISAYDDQQLDLESMIPNVTCERCHGPGRAHIARARRNAKPSELELPFGPGRWQAQDLLALCGSCHRHPAPNPVVDIRPENPTLVRFQPVGIMQSLCYRKGRGTFSCVTCHDPHARVSADRARYDGVCLSCHTDRNAPAASNDPSNHQPRASGAPCPVSPRARCVECHMPRVDAGQGILFSDHWIRVRRPAPAGGAQ